MPKCQIFSDAETKSLRKAGGILHGCLTHVSSLVRSGITTVELDAAAESFIRAHGGEPAFKGYQNYPATLCTSVNDEIVHAIPGSRQLQNGDIISLDCGVKINGLYTDACVTVPVGMVDDATKRFLAATSDALESVLKDIVKGGVRVGTISAYIQDKLESAGYAPVEQLTGHGLGTTLHQFPNIPNIGKKGTGPVLPAGTVVAIEPIATMGSPKVAQDDDAWTLRTQDGSLACHFEHTVLITEDGCEILA